MYEFLRYIRCYGSVGFLNLAKGVEDLASLDWFEARGLFPYRVMT